MSNYPKLTGVLRTTDRLTATLSASPHKLTAQQASLAKPIVDGLYDGGILRGDANGWYDDNQPGPVPSGIWNGGINEGMATGIYKDNHLQTGQFRTVINELNALHQPEHFGFWPLDGSLEEDEGRYPLVHSNLVDFVQMGGRQVARFGGVGASAMWGTEEDFRFMNDEQIFTMGGWFVSERGVNVAMLFGTTDAAARVGVRLFQSSDRTYSDIVTPEGYLRFTPQVIIRGSGVRFYVLQGSAEDISYSYNGLLADSRTINPYRGSSPSHLPFTVGLNAPDVPIWNAFATSAILSESEIYQLYVAGMQELMTF